MSLGNIYHVILFQPIINVLLLIYSVLSNIGIPGAFGLSIISLTVIVRLIIHPFYSHQMSTAKKMSEIKPHLVALSKKHKNDKKKLQEEQLRLYKEKGINPATGCLLALVQIPIFIALYQVLNLFLSNGKTSAAAVAVKINGLVYSNFLKIGVLDPWFFGYNLAVTPSQYSKYGIHYLLVPLVTAALQYFQIKASTPAMVGAIAKTDDKKPNENKDKLTQDDFSKAMSGQMKIIFPLMIAYFSYILPVGLAIYWNVFSIFTLLQKRQQDNQALKSENVNIKVQNQIKT